MSGTIKILANSVITVICPGAIHRGRNRAILFLATRARSSFAGVRAASRIITLICSAKSSAIKWGFDAAISSNTTRSTRCRAAIYVVARGAVALISAGAVCLGGNRAISISATCAGRRRRPATIARDIYHCPFAGMFVCGNVAAGDLLQ